MKVNKVEMVAHKSLRDCTNDSNTFRIIDMKNAFVETKKQRAEKNGLDRDGVECGISHKTAKTAMVAVAMSGSNELSFSRKTLLKKTESRYQSEHSLMMGYSYATTVLATHFLEGPTPKNMVSKFRSEKLSKQAKETLDCMKEALDADEIYPVNPNLVLSTDDMTLFSFQGTKNGSSDKWEWKIIDTSNGDSSVDSDFEVGDDAENSGGLRVRLTFTFTASGLAAPPYIAVSGLNISFA